MAFLTIGQLSPDLPATFCNALEAMSESKQSPSGGHDALAAAPAPEARKKRLLLIEDENAARIVLLQKLRAGGFDVDVAPNGRVALEKLRNSPPDAIFMDLLLPQVKGVDVIKEARRCKGFGKRPIYVCTSASNMEAWTRRGTKAGATKVFDRGATAIDEIVAAVAADLTATGASKEATEPQAENKPEPAVAPEPSPIVKSSVAGTGSPPPPPTPPPPQSPAKGSTFSDFHRPSPSFLQRALKVIGIAKKDGSASRPTAS